MGDNAAILNQRFLESEGELGRSFTRVLAKFGELQTALLQPKGAQSAAASAHVSATDALVAAPAAPPGAEDLFQSLLRDLATFEYTLRHARAVQDTSVREMAEYERQEATAAANTQRTVDSLVGLQAELASAKQWRSEQEEYERLTKTLLAVPSRADTEAQLSALAAGEEALIATRAGLLSELESKRTKHLLLSVAFEQLRAEWCAAERAEALATRSARAAAALEAEAERRRAEEEALAYAAAAAAKEEAAASLDAEADDGDEKKLEGMTGGAEGDEAEEGAVTEGGAPQPAASPAPSEEEGAVSAAPSPAASPAPDASASAGDAPMQIDATADSAVASSGANSPAAAAAEAQAAEAERTEDAPVAESDGTAPAAADSAAPMET